MSRGSITTQELETLAKLYCQPIRGALLELVEIRWAVTILRALYLEGRPPTLSSDLPAYESILKWWREYKPGLHDRARQWACKHVREHNYMTNPPRHCSWDCILTRRPCKGFDFCSDERKSEK